MISPPQRVSPPVMVWLYRRSIDACVRSVRSGTCGNDFSRLVVASGIEPSAFTCTTHGVLHHEQRSLRQNIVTSLLPSGRGLCDVSCPGVSHFGHRLASSYVVKVIYLRFQCANSLDSSSEIAAQS